MMRIEDEIRIAAPPETVWRVTTDVERWPEWTPTVTRVRRIDAGPLAVGSAVEIRQPAMPAVIWTVTELAPPRRFAWEGRLRGLRMVATHELSPDGSGTRNRLSIELTGPLAPLLGPLLRWSVGRALRRENRGLRTRCTGVTSPPDLAASQEQGPARTASVP